MALIKQKIVKKTASSSFDDDVAWELPKIKKAIEKALNKDAGLSPTLKKSAKGKAEAQAKKLTAKKNAAYLFGFGDGVQTIAPKLEGTLEITDIGAYKYTLKDWNLLVTDLDVIPLEGKVGHDVHLPVGMSQGILVGENGYRVDFCNITKITLLTKNAKPPKKVDDDHLFLGDVPNDAKGWFVVVKTSNRLNLDDIRGQTIPVNPESYGMLIGPAGNVLSFSHIKKIIVPKGEK